MPIGYTIPTSALLARQRRMAEACLGRAAKVAVEKLVKGEETGLNRLVVIPLDGSVHSHDAVDWAKDHFLLKNDAVLLFTTIIPYDDSWALGELHPGGENFEKSREFKDAEAYLQKIKAELAGTCGKVETAVLVGDPREQIVDLADKVGADVLLMGSRGLGPIRRALLGSVSSYIVNHAHCPVLISKAGDAKKQRL